MGTPCRPIRDFLAHDFWVPFSRLSYGALLSHGIWMQFRDFNTERGTWACGFDAFLFFLAYVAFSFLFSFLTAMAWEQPIASLWLEFVLKPRDAKAFYQGKRSITVAKEEEPTTVQDVIKSRKQKLEGGDIKIRKSSGDTEDLEEDGKKLYSFKAKQ